MMRHRRNSDFGAVPGNCCRCGCSLCGPGDLLSKKGGGGSLLASVSPLFRPRCVLHCQVPSCDFSTSDGLADFERHLYSEHRDSIVLTEEPNVLPVASALLPPTSKSAVIADLLTPYVDIKVKEEPGSGEGGATAGGGRKRRRQATRRPRKRRRDDEDDLVQDDEEEDEDYKWEDDLYGAWEEGDEDYGYEQEVEEDEGEEEDKGYFVKEPDDDSDEDGTGGRYQCNVCNYTTDDAMRMDKHAAGHTGQDVTCKYLDCDFTTDHWTNLSSHEAATHLRWIRNAFRDNTALVDSLVSLDVGNDARNSWKCRSCDHSESSKEKATLHASREHPDLVELKEVCCTDCDFISKHHKEMRDHFKKLHLAYDEQYSLPSGSGGRPRKGKPSGAVGGGIKTESREEESTCVCFTCGYKAACKRSLRLHERREHGIGGGGGDRRQREDAKPLPKAHLCDQCGYSCRTPQELGKHRENKHGFFSCHMCSYSTNKKVELTRHLRCAHKTICPECELPLSRGETLETHQCPAAMGPAEGRPELLVQLLAGTTKTKANAKINRLAGENGDGFICVECGHSGDQLLMLQRHVNMRHSSFFCNHCDFRTVNHPTLMKHLKKNHLFPCNQPGCSFAGDTREELLSHDCGEVNEASKKERRHQMKIKAATCPHCGYIVNNANSLRTHIRRKHQNSGRPYHDNKETCTTCGKSFQNKNHLRAHVRAVHEGMRDYKCHECDYTTGWRVSLRKHLEKAHGVFGLFRCRQCPFETSALTKLVKHQETDHGEGQGEEAPDHEPAPALQVPPSQVPLSLAGPPKVDPGALKGITPEYEAKN